VHVPWSLCASASRLPAMALWFQRVRLNATSGLAVIADQSCVHSPAAAHRLTATWMRSRTIRCQTVVWRYLERCVYCGSGCGEDEDLVWSGRLVLRIRGTAPPQRRRQTRLTVSRRLVGFNKRNGCARKTLCWMALVGLFPCCARLLFCALRCLPRAALPAVAGHSAVLRFAAKKVRTIAVRGWTRGYW